MNDVDGNRSVEHEPASPRCAYTLGDDGERCCLRKGHEGNHQFVIEFDQQQRAEPPEALLR
jgi:hypothetical protein